MRSLKNTTFFISLLGLASLAIISLAQAEPGVKGGEWEMSFYSDLTTSIKTCSLKASPKEIDIHPYTIFISVNSNNILFIQVQDRTNQALPQNDEISLSIDGGSLFRVTSEQISEDTFGSAIEDGLYKVRPFILEAQEGVSEINSTMTLRTSYLTYDISLMDADEPFYLFSACVDRLDGTVRY